MYSKEKAMKIIIIEFILVGFYVRFFKLKDTLLKIKCIITFKLNFWDCYADV